MVRIEVSVWEIFQPWRYLPKSWFRCYDTKDMGGIWDIVLSSKIFLLTCDEWFVRYICICYGTCEFWVSTYTNQFACIVPVFYRCIYNLEHTYGKSIWTKQACIVDMQTGLYSYKPRIHNCVPEHIYTYLICRMYLVFSSFPFDYAYSLLLINNNDFITGFSLSFR